jgi:hypothetical protein
MKNYRKKTKKVLTFFLILGILITVAAKRCYKAFVSGGFEKKILTSTSVVCYIKKVAYER